MTEFLITARSFAAMIDAAAQQLASEFGMPFSDDEETYDRAHWRQIAEAALRAALASAEALALRSGLTERNHA